MNVINKIPGPLLIFMGALSLSFGGLIVKKFEGSTEGAKSFANLNHQKLKSFIHVNEKTS